ncbi:MAG: hypothetical protein A2817_03565 [Candidatus Yanofskybacteria bacterium RIFCSPHIGHO2_01_FULL_39_8b]|uniref:DUF3800 domain-containing protein n=1 Tax=Candidatus Yanofskybacteria bacterium RIFCSPHIGHO2_01_FULL_39_8b TaxID=1802659 RepID=A0A1F8E994_9BACT|nr:MAG: hypothetical protein A2817_03565 [Candidatus Yanofskybacteria bacterium RIFCSPHIGHO2_01_FULL_39_8b]
MQQYKLLSLDETGKASFNHPSKLFILSGVVIPEKYKQKLDNKIRRLKKKFFNDEEVVFHSRDMSRRKGQFAILQDPKKELQFWSEFISIANNDEVSLLFVVVNKEKAKALCWLERTILKRAYRKILEEFAAKQLIKTNGKIIAESDPSQDIYLIEAHNLIQANGVSDGSISAGEYRQKITSLSLVNKSNFDVDIQMADSLALIAGIIYESKFLKNNTIKLNKIEKMKVRLIDRKINKKENPSSFTVLI